jgi:2-succinyl-6-hydroxy-2,4-cyclohexadiene-1-carboxylate synthase
MYRWNFVSSDNLLTAHLPPLLLLHGWMGSSADYAELIDILKHRYTCIAIDLPGHGNTEVADDLGYNFIDTARGIIELLNDLDIDRTSICGYSFGGRLAVYLALEFPDRFDRVILESTSVGLPTLTQRQARTERDRQIIDRLQTEDFGDFVSWWYRQPIFTGIDRHPDFERLCQRRIATNQPQRLAKSLEAAGLGVQPYLGNRLKTYQTPISLIVGALDRKFAEIGQDLQRNYLAIDLHIVPNSSHNVHFSQPQAWLAASRLT